MTSLSDPIGITVTVLMPVYNGEQYLREAIDSILGQTFSDFDLLIINDGSTDNSVKIVSSYKDPRIKLIHNTSNLGLIATLNKGLDLAQGRYIARMDCDDISMPERLSKQVSFLDAHPEIGICGTWIRTIGESNGEVHRYPTEPDRIACELLFESSLAHPTVMMRTAFLKQNGLYFEEYLFAEDYRMWIRASRVGKLANIGEVLLHYRTSSASTSGANKVPQLLTLDRIATEQFMALQLPLPHELALHHKISSGQIEASLDFMTAAELWLKRLVDANEASNLYPPVKFREVIGNRWRIVAGLSSKLGLWTWKGYWKSSLSGSLKMAIWDRLWFFVKCLFRYDAVMVNRFIKNGKFTSN